MTELPLVVRHPDVGAVRGDGIGVAEPVASSPTITLTRPPVQALELGDRVAAAPFATQTWVAVRGDGIRDGRTRSASPQITLTRRARRWR